MGRLFGVLRGADTDIDIDLATDQLAGGAAALKSNAHLRTRLARSKYYLVLVILVR